MYLFITLKLPVTHTTYKYYCIAASQSPLPICPSYNLKWTFELFLAPLSRRLPRACWMVAIPPNPAPPSPSIVRLVVNIFKHLLWNHLVKGNARYSVLSVLWFTLRALFCMTGTPLFLHFMYDQLDWPLSYVLHLSQREMHQSNDSLLLKKHTFSHSSILIAITENKKKKQKQKKKNKKKKNNSPPPTPINIINLTPRASLSIISKTSGKSLAAIKRNLLYNGHSRDHFSTVPKWSFRQGVKKIKANSLDLCINDTNEFPCFIYYTVRIVVVSTKRQFYLFLF